MASIFKRKGDERWTMSWFDHEGRRREQASGTTDKKLAQRLANDIEDRELERKRGLIDPAAERLALARSAPLDQNLDAYESHLTHLQRNQGHVATTLSYIRRTANGLGWTCLGDINAETFVAYLSDLSEQRNTGHRTFNAALVACRSFCSWCVRTNRLVMNPLASVPKRNDEEDRRRIRRDISLEELAWIVRVAAATPTVAISKKCDHGKPRDVRIKAPDRAVAYLIAAETGFRASEVSSLTPESFNLASNSPTIVVEAGYSKRRRRDEQPIRPHFAEMLRAWLVSKPAQMPVCPLPKSRAGAMLGADMESARRLWIDEGTTPQERAKREASDFLRPVDSAGRVADFHCLRVHFVSRVVETGATIKEAMTLARHADPKLTLKTYAKVDLCSLSRVLDRMSRPVGNPSKAAEKLRATGTDSCPQKSPQSSLKPVQTRATRCDDIRSDSESESDGKGLRIAGLRDSVRLSATPSENRGGGIRTPDLLTPSQAR
jgi:integrase/recombinase XerD